MPYLENVNGYGYGLWEWGKVSFAVYFLSCELYVVFCVLFFFFHSLNCWRENKNDYDEKKTETGKAKATKKNNNNIYINKPRMSDIEYKPSNKHA